MLKQSRPPRLRKAALSQRRCISTSGRGREARSLAQLGIVGAGTPQKRSRHVGCHSPRSLRGVQGARVSVAAVSTAVGCVELRRQAASLCCRLPPLPPPLPLRQVRCCCLPHPLLPPLPLAAMEKRGAGEPIPSAQMAGELKKSGTSPTSGKLLWALGCHPICCTSSSTARSPIIATGLILQWRARRCCRQGHARCPPRVLSQRRRAMRIR